MTTLTEVKKANSRFFSKDSRNFHGDRKYRIKKDMLIIEFENELSNHQKVKGETLYYIQPSSLDLVHIGTISKYTERYKRYYIYLMENDEVVRYHFDIHSGRLGAKSDTLHDD